jgi:hypothetical protein
MVKKNSFSPLFSSLTMESDPRVINSLQLLSAFAGALKRQSNAKKRSSDDKKQGSLKKKFKEGRLNIMAV